MGVLDRVSHIVRSDLNDMLSRADDPVRLLDEHLLDMKDLHGEVVQQIVHMMACERQIATRVKQSKKDSQRWYERAEAAVKAGDDDQARLALATRLDVDRETEELTRRLGVAQEYYRTLKTSLEALEDRVAEARRRRDVAPELARVEVRASQQPAGPRPMDTSALDGPGPLDDFERLTNAMELADFEAVALRTLDADLLVGDMERRFEELTHTPETNDRLAELKRKVEQSR